MKTILKKRISKGWSIIWNFIVYLPITLLLVYVIHVSCYNTQDAGWNAIQFYIELCSIFYLIIVLLNLALNRYTFDKWIAKGNGKLLAVATFLVLSTPFVVSFVANLPILNTPENSLSLTKWPEEKEFLNNYYNPFVNPGSFDSRPISQVVLSILGIILFSGILVSLVVNYLEQRSNRWKNGELHYSFGSWLNLSQFDYCVVIGGHETSYGLISQLVHKYNRVIIFTDRNIMLYRSEVESILDNEKLSKKLVFYYGKRNSESDLIHLDVHSSNLKDIYIIGENKCNGELEEAHDALNMRCVSVISELLENKKRKEKLNCYVFFENQSTALLFQKKDLDVRIKKNINFIAFNFYELWAQKVISGYEGLNFPSKFPFNNIDKEESLDSELDKHFHIIIIGMTKSGIALALEAARSCHYPNFAASQMEAEFGNADNRKASIQKMSNRRTRITFIDTNAKTQEISFKARHPHLYDFCRWKSAANNKWNEPQKQDDNSLVYTDVEFEFIQANIESSETRKYILSSVNEPTALVTIASCMSSTPKSFSTIMYLPLSEDQKRKVNMLVFQPIDSSLVDILPENILSFGKIADTIDLNYIHKLESSAKRINYVWSKKDLFEMSESNNSFDTKIEPLINEVWQEQTEAKRWSSRYQASAIMQRRNWDNYNQIEKSSIPKDKTLWFDGIMERTEHNRWIISQLIFSAEPRCFNAEDTRNSFIFDTRLSYRQLYIESCSSTNENKRKMYKALLGNIDDKEIRETNDRMMIRNTDWIQSKF